MAPIKSVLLAGLSLLSESLAVKLLATHFSGQIYTLNLSLTNATSGTLSVTQKVDGCGVTPTWLYLDEETRTLYCFDESWQGSGVIEQYSLSPRRASANTLKLTGSAPTPGNSVHGSLYGGRDGKSFVITAE
jgi:6-phosphogluconolactonase (cycloisomerase 2 family)